MITTKKMFQIVPNQDILKGEIAGAHIGRADVTNEQIVVDGFYLLLIERGTMVVSINGMACQTVGDRVIIFLFKEATIRFVSADERFSARHIILSSKFVYELSLPRKLFPDGFFSRLYYKPLASVNQKRMSHLSMRITTIIDAINDVSHMFYREMVICAFSMLLLDISNITPRQSRNRADMKASRMDDLLLEFVKLLEEYGRKKRGIPFYAGKLCITPQYLSRLVRHCTTKTVYFHICHALMSEAKSLLRSKYGTIQQISEKMNFSDQAAFGKFFKKHEGVSPIEYRKKW